MNEIDWDGLTIRGKACGAEQEMEESNNSKMSVRGIMTMINRRPVNKTPLETLVDIRPLQQPPDEKKAEVMWATTADLHLMVAMQVMEAEV